MDFYYEKFAARIQSIIEKYKGKTAYIIGDREVSYAQMDEMARHIASGVARKVGDKAVGDVPVRIGISLSRSEDYVPCILAAGKLGCSYVPIDVETPEDRRDLSVSCNKVGDILEAQGDLPGALKRRAEAVA